MAGNQLMFLLHIDVCLSFSLFPFFSLISIKNSFSFISPYFPNFWPGKCSHHKSNNMKTLSMVSNTIGVECKTVYNQVSNISIICPYKYLNTMFRAALFIIAQNLEIYQTSTIRCVNRGTDVVYPYIGLRPSNKNE